MTGKDESAPPLMTVRQLAQQGDVTVHVVRNYLRRGLLQAATHTEGGYQLFSASELQRLHFIRTAQQLGFTLAEIEEIIRHSLQRHSPCPLVRDIIRRRLDDTRHQLDTLLAMHGRMEHAVRAWASLPDSIPTGNDVCALIESVAAAEGGGFVKSTPRRLLGRRPTEENLP
ncbi:MerR family transcriptional regulator [Thermomonas fusca]|uniref:MerR family transcriptional regulator n=1 Tax=Thermomonas fusca TaxID=215690 RepID=UPI0004278DF6|nr:MerR family transcriptional regulator [Thermomonas fusca]